MGMSKDPLAVPRGIKNSLIIVLILFWVPLGITITWLVNR